MKIFHFFAKSLVKTASLFAITLLLLNSVAQSKEAWDWKKKPSNNQWKAFFALEPAEQEKIWKKIEGVSLDEMAWEWRMAWVRSCARSSSIQCSKILQLGLFDKAMVVRAEAASRLGDRFAGTGHKPVIRVLRTAYGIQQNSRSQKPLYVQYRILHALNRIGGEGIETGRQLALNTQSTKRYWTALASNAGDKKKALR